MRDKILKEELEKLNKISKLGSKSASDALSKMTNQDIAVHIAESRLIEVEKLSTVVDGDTLSVAVYLRIEGDIHGGVVLLLPEGSALALLDLLFKKEKGTHKKIDQEGESALKETGNILVGNYLAALADSLGFNLLESIPDITKDLANAIMNALAIELSENSNDAIIFDTQFEISGTDVSGQMIIFFDEDCGDQLVEALKK